MRVDLRPMKDRKRWAPKSIEWKSCLPFVKNERAVLIHRPRSVATYLHMERPYISITAWCGNQFTGSKEFTFLADVPRGELLCERCEKQATKVGEFSSDLMCNRHVHRGKVAPEQTCCIDAERGAT